MAEPVDAKLLADILKNIPFKKPDETQFQVWQAMHNVPMSGDYNMRGYYNGLMGFDPAAISSVNPNDNQMHFPDKWKMPNHATFSTDSQYYNPQTMPNTPTWSGGNLPNNGASWALRRPSGEVVAAEAPWYKNGGFIK